MLTLLALGLISFTQVVESDVDNPPPSSAPRLQAESGVEVRDMARGRSGRYDVYLAINEHAPGARASIDSDSETGLDVLYLKALGGVRDVRYEPLQSVALASKNSTTASGEFRSLEWSLHVDGPGADLLKVMKDNATTRIVDSRLILGLEDESEKESRGSSSHGSRSVARDGLADTAIALSLMLLGGLFIPRGLLGGWVRYPAAFLVGLSTIGLIGIARLSSLWPVLFLLALALTAALTLARSGAPSWWLTKDWPALLSVSMVTLTICTWTRAYGLISASPDSFRYLSGGQLLASGQLDITLLDSKHMIAQQGMHAPGFALGVEGFQSLGPMSLAAVIALIALGSLPPMGQRKPWTLPIAGFGALVIASSQPIRLMSAYVNAHVVVGAVLALLVVIWLEGFDKDEDIRRSSQLPAAIAVSALVLLRPEGTLLGGLVLLGVLAGRRMRHDWSQVWVALGLFTAAWQLSLVWSSVARGVPPSTISLAMLTLGALSILGGLLAPRTPLTIGRAVPPVVGVLLWSGVLAVYWFAPESVTFFEAAHINLGEGMGGWGSTGIAIPSIAIAGLAVSAFSRWSDRFSIAKWILIGFVPVTMYVKLADGLHDRPGIGRAEILETYLSGGGRVGWGDSSNRMWTHAAFVAILLFSAVVARGVSSEAASRWRLSSVGAAILVLGAWPIMWQPDYLDSRLVRSSPWVLSGLLIAMMLVAVRGSSPASDSRSGHHALPS